MPLDAHLDIQAGTGLEKNLDGRELGRYNGVVNRREGQTVASVGHHPVCAACTKTGRKICDTPDQKKHKISAMISTYIGQEDFLHFAK